MFKTALSTTMKMANTASKTVLQDGEKIKNKESASNAQLKFQIVMTVKETLENSQHARNALKGTFLMKTMNLVLIIQML